MSGGTKDKQETKLNNRRVVVMMAARSGFSFDSKFVFVFVFFLHVFPLPARPRNPGTDDTSLPLPSLPVLSAE